MVLVTRDTESGQACAENDLPYVLLDNDEIFKIVVENLKKFSLCSLEFIDDTLKFFKTSFRKSSSCCLMNNNFHYLFPTVFNFSINLRKHFVFFKSRIY